MSNNLDFLRLNDALPGDIARRKAMGDLAGAIRLIDARLAAGLQPELAPRLRVERMRLERLPDDYPYTRAQALEQIRSEWPACTEAQFDALVDGGRIDWRCVDGEPHYHDRLLECLRLYPQEAPGLRREEDPGRAERDAVLERMEAEGGLTARITVRASIRGRAPADHLVEEPDVRGLFRDLPLSSSRGLGGPADPDTRPGAAGV